MNKKVAKGNVKDTMREPESSAHKKPYNCPTLNIFGSLHLLTQGSGSRRRDGRFTRMDRSDRRLKENIVRIGTHPLGFGLYLFDFKPEYRSVCGDGRQFGVMADEVETVLPSAVAVNLDGYKTVDYAMLGISTPH